MNIKHLSKYVASIFIFVFIAKVIGLFKDVTLASKFGLGSDLDVYFYIFNISVLFSGVWLSILTVVILPLLTKENNSEKFQALVNNLRKINNYISAISALCFFIYLLYFDNFIGKAGDKWIYVLLGVSIIYFGFQAALYSSVLMAKGNNSNSLLESLPSLLTLAFILMFYSAKSVIVGTVLGFFLYYVATYSISRRYFDRVTQSGYKFEINSELKQIGKGVGLLLLGQVILSFTSLIDQLYLSSISQGSLTLFNYANKILLILTGISSIVMVRAFIPFFSINTKYSKLKVLLFPFLLLMLSLSVVYYLSDFSSSLIGLIYGYGKFDSTAISGVSEVLSIILYQAPFFVSSLILLSYFSSKNFYYPFLYTGILGFITKVIYLTLCKDQMNVSVLAYSTVIMYSINFFVLVFSLYFFKEK